MTGRTPFGWKALAVALVLGALGFLFAFKPLIMPARSSPWHNEESAAASLRTYCGAQNMFRRNDWDGDGVFEYAFPYTLLNTQLDENGERIRLIDDVCANASRDDSPSGKTTRKSGYIFVDITRDAAGEAYDDGEGNYVKGFGLCAYPAVYGRTGRLTFVVNIEGTVYWKDTGGKPVTVFPDVEEERWERIGE